MTLTVDLQLSNRGEVDLLDDIENLCLSLTFADASEAQRGLRDATNARMEVTDGYNLPRFTRVR